MEIPILVRHLLLYIETGPSYPFVMQHAQEHVMN